MLQITVLCELLYCPGLCFSGVSIKVNWLLGEEWWPSPRCRHTLYSLRLIEWFHAIQHSLTAHSLMENSEGGRQVPHTQKHTQSSVCKQTHTHAQMMTLLHTLMNPLWLQFCFEGSSTWLLGVECLYMHLLQITFYKNWLPHVVHDCTLGAKIAKLCHCSLDRIHIVATWSLLCA